MNKILIHINIAESAELKKMGKNEIAICGTIDLLIGEIHKEILAETIPFSIDRHESKVDTWDVFGVAVQECIKNSIFKDYFGI